MTLRTLALWLPPLALMGLIFFFSAQPDLNSGLGTLDTIGRKIIHFAQYALLAYLWWRALGEHTTASRAALAAFLVTVLYAVTDEYHQTFVDGRHGSPIDVLIDSAGAGVASLYLAKRRDRARA